MLKSLIYNTDTYQVLNQLQVPCKAMNKIDTVLAIMERRTSNNAPSSINAANRHLQVPWWEHRVGAPHLMGVWEVMEGADVRETSHKN